MASGRRKLWQYSHSFAILSAVLLFTAAFLCVLLWTNNIVRTATSVANPSISTFTYLSPPVSTFTLTYNVAIFGAAWNSILFVALLILERDALFLSTEELRYEVERAAVIVSVVGNALYSVACIALMSTLAQLAANAYSSPPGTDPQVIASARDRRAGQGAVAAFAGLAAATALWSCTMDILHALKSQHRSNVKGDVLRSGNDVIKGE